MLDRTGERSLKERVYLRPFLAPSICVLEFWMFPNKKVATRCTGQITRPRNALFIQEARHVLPSEDLAYLDYGMLQCSKSVLCFSHCVKLCSQFHDRCCLPHSPLLSVEPLYSRHHWSNQFVHYIHVKWGVPNSGASGIFLVGVVLRIQAVEHTMWLHSRLGNHCSHNVAGRCVWLKHSVHLCITSLDPRLPLQKG